MPCLGTTAAGLAAAALVEVTVHQHLHLPQTRLPQPKFLLAEVAYCQISIACLGLCASCLIWADSHPSTAIVVIPLLVTASPLYC
jgi:hypothetical protein